MSWGAGPDGCEMHKCVVETKSKNFVYMDVGPETDSKS